MAVSTATVLEANITQAVAAAGGTDPVDEFVNAWRQIEYNLTAEDIPMGARRMTFLFSFACLSSVQGVAELKDVMS